MEFHNNLTDIFKTLNNSHEDIIRTVCDELGQEDKADELVKKLMDTAYLRVKIKKDPNRVKRAKSCYMYFCEEHRKSVQDNNPGKKLGDISKILGKLWGDTSEEDRRKYHILHEKDKERYEYEK